MIDMVPTFTTSNERICLLMASSGQMGSLRIEDAERLQVCHHLGGCQAATSSEDDMKQEDEHGPPSEKTYTAEPIPCSSQTLTDCCVCVRCLILQGASHTASADLVCPARIVNCFHMKCDSACSW